MKNKITFPSPFRVVDDNFPSCVTSHGRDYHQCDYTGDATFFYTVECVRALSEIDLTYIEKNHVMTMNTFDKYINTAINLYSINDDALDGLCSGFRNEFRKFINGEDSIYDNINGTPTVNNINEFIQWVSRRLMLVLAMNEVSIKVKKLLKNNYTINELFTLLVQSVCVKLTPNDDYLAFCKDVNEYVNTLDNYTENQDYSWVSGRLCKFKNQFIRLTSNGLISPLAEVVTQNDYQKFSHNTAEIERDNYEPYMGMTKCIKK